MLRLAAPSPGHPQRSVDTDPAPDLERWVADGLISREQAEAIIAHDALAPAEPPPVVPPAARPHRRVPVVAEALGYLGGMLAAAGGAVTVARFWDELGVAGHVTVAVLALALFVGTGTFIRDDAEPALLRLRGFLWLGASAAAFLLGTVVVHDLVGSDHDPTSGFGGAVAATAASGALWMGKRRPVQQAATLVFAVATIGTGLNMVADSRLVGVAMWLTGATLLVLGLQRRTPTVWITLAVGAMAAFVGSLLPMDRWGQRCATWALVTALVVLVLPLLDRIPLRGHERVMLIVLGSFGALNTLATALAYWAHDAGIATGLVVWAAGAALLAVALWRELRSRVFLQVVGGLAVVGGAALTGVQSVAVATVFGLVTAVALLAAGMLPGRVLLSVFGSLGLLVNVPWSIQHFFPGEGRVPLLVAAAGAVLVMAAVLLVRMSNRFRTEVRN